MKCTTLKCTVQCVLTYVYTHVTITQIKIQIIFMLPKGSFLSPFKLMLKLYFQLNFWLVKDFFIKQFITTDLLVLHFLVLGGYYIYLPCLYFKDNSTGEIGG